MSSSTPSAESSSSISASLLERVRAFDAEAWARLSHLYGPVVYGWARGAGLQASDAEDVVQEVFRSICGGIAKFRRENPGDTFRGWVWAITRNAIRNHLREKSARTMASGGSVAHGLLASVPDSPPATSADGGLSEQRGLYQRTLAMIEAEFSFNHWQAFLRTSRDGRPATDVAEELGLSVWAVYHARSRILRRIRQTLDGLVDETPGGPEQQPA